MQFSSLASLLVNRIKMNFYQVFMKQVQCLIFSISFGYGMVLLQIRLMISFCLFVVETRGFEIGDFNAQFYWELDLRMLMFHRNIHPSNFIVAAYIILSQSVHSTISYNNKQYRSSLKNPQWSYSSIIWVAIGSRGVLGRWWSILLLNASICDCLF